MFNQDAKWLKVTLLESRGGVGRLDEMNRALLAGVAELPERSHQDRLHPPRGGQEAEVVRVDLPPDTNTLLSVASLLRSAA